MARCSGCSRSFDLLAVGRRCAACIRRSTGETTPWPQCIDCGGVYEFLDGKICGECSDHRQNLGEVAREAVNNPVNPRTHTPYPGTSTGGSSGSQSDPLLDRAAATISAMAHSNAVARANAPHGMKVSGSKIRGTLPPHLLVATTTRPAKEVHFRIDRIRHRVPIGRDVGPEIPSELFSFKDGTPLADAYDRLMRLVREAYIDKYKHTIYDCQSEVTLMWCAGKVKVDESFIQLRTVGDFWRVVCNNSSFVSPADKKATRVQLYALVLYPRNTVSDADDDYESTSLATQVANTSTSLSVKRTRIQPTGQYITRVQANPAQLFVAKKFLFVKGNDNERIWTESSARLEVALELEPFASGMTKRAYKAIINNEHFAAKSFYDLGYGSPTKEENLDALKEELLRNEVLKDFVDRFGSLTRKHKISAYELCAQNAFIVTAVDGPKADQSWIVDPLFEGAETRKFSGSDQAGSNSKDLVGMTCDAFAHFSYFDSKKELVFADIQGIDTMRLPATSRRKSEIKLVLFDVMIHSSMFTYGHGDFGPQGLVQFASQHRCNSICEGLGLPPLAVGEGASDDPHTDVEGGNDDSASEGPSAKALGKRPAVDADDDE